MSLSSDAGSSLGVVISLCLCHFLELPTVCAMYLHDVLCTPPVYAVHCGSTRQTASIIKMDKDHLRTGDKASCHFRFIKNPEFLKPGTRMVFREGRTKAIGSVSKIYPIAPGASQMIGSKLKPSAKHFLHRPGAQGGGGNRGRRRGGKKHSKAPPMHPTSIAKDVPTPPSLNPSVVPNSPQKEEP